MIFVFRFVSNPISHYVFRSKSLSFQNQEVTISLRVFCKKWFGTCMICPINWSKKMVPLEMFCARRDSFSIISTPPRAPVYEYGRYTIQSACEVRLLSLTLASQEYCTRLIFSSSSFSFFQLFSSQIFTSSQINAPRGFYVVNPPSPLTYCL